MSLSVSPRSPLQGLAAFCFIALCTLSGTVLIVLNPAYYWDDWLWRFTDSQRFVELGIQTGAWWSGHLSAQIYSLDNTILVMRLVSLLGWLVSGLAIAYLLIRTGLATDGEALLWLGIFLACSVGLIRFIPSVAMYPVFMASFFLAWAILARWPGRLAPQILAVVLLVFSFHLPSLIPLFGLMAIWLAWPSIRRRLPVDYRPRNLLGHPWTAFHKDLPKDALAYLRTHAFVLLAPVAFVLAIRLPSALMVRAEPTATNFYSGYNVFGLGDLIQSISRVVLELPTLVTSFLSLPATFGGLVFAIVFGAVVFGLLTVAVQGSPRARRRRSVAQIVAGGLLTMAGAFPYFVVGKPPNVNDFYDSRHILVAVPGVCTVILGAISLLTALVDRLGARVPAALFRNVAFAALIGLSISRSITVSLTLIVDWLGQQTTIQYLADNRKALTEVSLFIFNDTTSRVRISERFIWNYEYTSLVFSVFGDRKKIGLSRQEYEGSPVRSPLFFSDSYLRRHNAQDFDFYGPHIVLNLTNGAGQGSLSAGRAVQILLAHWRGSPVDYVAEEVVKIAPSLPLRASDKRGSQLSQVAAALENYRRDHGHYPTQVPPEMSPMGLLPVQLPGVTSPFQPTDPFWYLELSPYYIDHATLGGGCPRITDPSCGLSYFSNGVDYKIIQLNPRDPVYARQAYGLLYDRRRNLYGLWTPDAANW